MLELFKKPTIILLLILVTTAFLRLYRIDYPNTYVFDEVYHAFTAKEMLLGHPQAWEWWNTPPKGVAYEWTHPPFAKEAMVVSMWLLGSKEPWAWRIPGCLFGILSVYLTYKIALTLFKKPWLSVMAAFIFSIDGLNFVQSRTGMNDVYLVTFVLFSVLMFIDKRFFWSSLFFGLALSSKWSAIYILPVFLLFLIIHKQFKQLILYILIPPLVYLGSYLPFFTSGHNFDQFIQLHKQMWYYHSHLKATHDYASPWWSWPLNLFPVWYYVERVPNGLIANIFASGNPFLFWIGFSATVLTLFEAVYQKSEKLLLVLLCYLIFWLPWALSPRIMFLYHYSPSVPFMVIALSYQISSLNHTKNEKVLGGLILAGIGVSFLFVYPMLIGIPLPANLLLLFFRTNLTKNPFG